MSGDLLTLSIDARDQVTVLFVKGEADASSAGELDSALDKAAQRKMPVIIDVSDLGYIDSSAFRAIYRASEHTAISMVVSPGSVLSRTIRLSGISSKIPVFPDIGTASAVLARHSDAGAFSGRLTVNTAPPSGWLPAWM